MQCWPRGSGVALDLRGAGYCITGIRPCPAGKSIWQRDPLPTGSPKSQEAVEAAGELGLDKDARRGLPLPTTPASRCLCLLHHGRFAAQES